MRLLNRLEKRLGRYAIPNLTLILIGGQVIFFLAQFANDEFLDRVALVPARVLEGEVWRLVTFAFYPPFGNPFFALLFWWAFAVMGGALDNHWGTFRYNLFLLAAWAATVAAAFAYPHVAATNFYIGALVLLAFAWLYPEFVFLLMMIVPVKAKWLAWLTWAIYVYTLAVGPWSSRLMVLAASAVFFLFFGGDVYRRVRGAYRSSQRRFEAVREAETPFHRCAVCGKTDKSDPEEDFRYAQTPDGVKCFCSEHLQEATAAEQTTEAGRAG